MSQWNIVTWSTERREGSIASEHFPAPLKFGPEAAEVEDFEIGEPVEVALSRVGETMSVDKVRPVHSRPNPAAHTAPALPKDIATLLAEVNRVLGRSLLDAALHTGDEETTLTFFDGHRRPQLSLRFVEVSYQQGPLAMHVEAGTQMEIYRWAHFQTHNAPWVAHWSIEPSGIEADDFVFLLRAPSFGAPPSVICAASVVIKHGSNPPGQPTG